MGKFTDQSPKFIIQYVLGEKNVGAAGYGHEDSNRTISRRPPVSAWRGWINRKWESQVRLPKVSTIECRQFLHSFLGAIFELYNKTQERRLMRWLVKAQFKIASTFTLLIL